jgi:rhodanese-related sulfurtransferase
MGGEASMCATGNWNDQRMPGGPPPRTVGDLLAEARSGLRRLSPAEAMRAVRRGAILVDTRPEWQRRADGDIPGAVVVERNHLEWRCDPASPARVPEATDHEVAWIVCCDEGYSSSLAAASLQALGMHRATDVIGGFRAWRAAGLPVTAVPGTARPRLAPASATGADAGDPPGPAPSADAHDPPGPAPGADAHDPPGPAPGATGHGQ